jgi:hypothetical protein
VFTADGVEIAQFGSERRRFVPIAQAPQLLKDTVLAVEDTGFYDHGGISWRGVARAFVANLTGGMPQGASTITQQVARTFFLSTRRTPERKIKEALLALRIERALGKDQILELYLNQIYLGQRSYGFGAAAQAYFGKTLEVKIPPGTQPEEEIVLQGEGLPDWRTGERGDLILKVKVELPKRLSSEGEEVLKRLAEREGWLNSESNNGLSPKGKKREKKGEKTSKKEGFWEKFLFGGRDA